MNSNINRRAFLEVINGIPLDDFVYISIMPLIERGFEVLYYDSMDNPDPSIDGIFVVSKKLGGKANTHVRPTNLDIFVGSVEVTNVFFDMIGVKTPEYLGYPKELKRFYNRNIRIGKFGDLNIEKLPVFIKPSKQVKLFTGFLLENDRMLSNIKLYYNSVSDETDIFISDPIDITTEYRCFVKDDKLVGLKHYYGSFNHFIDAKKVEEMIESYKTNPHRPVCYTLDVARDFDGNTILIEINDFWAIGSYGMDGKTYVSMLIKRMEQIKNENRI